MSETTSTFIIPPQIVTRVDVSRMIRELETINNELTAIEARAKVGVKTAVQPTISPRLGDFLVQNKLSLQTAKQREALLAALQNLKNTAPVIHMTFATEADRQSLERLAQYIRTAIHPYGLISVGLQPGLVAGVQLRTPNHIHDFSLRSKLIGGRDILTKQFEALGQKGAA